MVAGCCAPSGDANCVTKQFTQLREEINQSRTDVGSAVKRQEAETAVAEADSASEPGAPAPLVFW